MTDSATVARTDQIQLEFPASPEYGRVARIAAAHLAIRNGFSLNEIDDLRLAMDEAAVMLLGPGLQGERLEITYTVSDGIVSVDAQVTSDAAIAIPAERIERFDELAGELVDTYDVDAASRRLTLAKSRSTPH